MTWQSNEQACYKSNICLKLQSNTTTINLETMKMYSKTIHYPLLTLRQLRFMINVTTVAAVAGKVGVVDVVRVVGEVAVGC